MNFRVVWKKRNYDVTFPLDQKALKLKEHIQKLTGNWLQARSLDIEGNTMVSILYTALLQDQNKRGGCSQPRA